MIERHFVLAAVMLVACSASKESSDQQVAAAPPTPPAQPEVARPAPPGAPTPPSSAPIEPAFRVAGQAAMRTSSRRPYVRLTVENPTNDPQSVRVLSVTYHAESGERPATVARVEIHEAAEFTDTGGRISHGLQGSEPWITVPPGSHWDLDVVLEGREARYNPMSVHSFVVLAEHQGHPPLTIEAQLSDGIRHPRRR